jgi:hypothetical protein
MVTELRYIDGIEKIEALFTAVLTGLSFFIGNNFFQNMAVLTLFYTHGLGA